jgi:hypothetical protein
MGWLTFVMGILLLVVMSESAFAAEGWQAKPENLKKVGKEWGLGYKPKLFADLPTIKLSAPGDTYPGRFDLEMFPHEHTPTMNQGPCGSCVYFSYTYNYEESLRLRGIKIPSLSQQHLMNCSGEGSQCNGAYGEDVGRGLVKLKTLHALADYPYTAKTASCKSVSGQRHGQIVAYKNLESVDREIIAAINLGMPASVGVAAGGSWGGYAGGVYNACNSMGVNHYVVIVGYDCETSVDANGKCVFDAQGNVANGMGTWLIQNSWGNGFGVQGRITQKIRKNGKRCNAVAMPGDIQVLDIGIPMPDGKPVPFEMKSSSVLLKAVWLPGGKSLEDYKYALQKSLNMLGDK